MGAARIRAQQDAPLPGRERHNLVGWHKQPPAPETTDADDEDVGPVMPAPEAHLLDRTATTPVPADAEALATGEPVGPIEADRARERELIQTAGRLECGLLLTRRHRYCSPAIVENHPNPGKTEA